VVQEFIFLNYGSVRIVYPSAFFRALHFNRTKQKGVVDSALRAWMDMGV
jgi:hypothetical protein